MKLATAVYHCFARKHWVNAFLTAEWLLRSQIPVLTILLSIQLASSDRNQREWLRQLAHCWGPGKAEPQMWPLPRQLFQNSTCHSSQWSDHPGETLATSTARVGELQANGGRMPFGKVNEPKQIDQLRSLAVLLLLLLILFFLLLFTVFFLFLFTFLDVGAGLA